jgi:hypothetical protein
MNLKQGKLWLPWPPSPLVQEVAITRKGSGYDPVESVSLTLQPQTSYFRLLISSFLNEVFRESTMLLLGLFPIQRHLSRETIFARNVTLLTAQGEATQSKACTVPSTATAAKPRDSAFSNASLNSLSIHKCEDAPKTE